MSLTVNVLRLIAEGLDVISALVTKAEHDPVKALHVIESVVEELRKGLDGKVSVEACHEAITALHGTLEGHDAVADAALVDRFSDS